MQKIVPVKVDGIPSEEVQQSAQDEQSSPLVTKPNDIKPSHDRIMVTIQTREVLYLRKSNLDYAGLKVFVEKMEKG